MGDLNVGARWNWVVSFMPLATLPLWNEHPLERSLGGPWSRSGYYEEKKYLHSTQLCDVPEEGRTCRIHFVTLLRIKYFFSKHFLKREDMFNQSSTSIWLRFSFTFSATPFCLLI
jgi:hypothetical protein